MIVPKILRGQLENHDNVLLNSKEVFARLMDEVEWRQESITLFGRRVAQPRLMAWYGDEGTAYTYSGLKNEPLPWSPLLLDLKHRVEELSGHTFNSVLLNLYRDGNDSMGYHSDDERELGSNPVIASLSLGAKRKFNLKQKSTKELVSIELHDNSLLIMKGELQENWKHAIPKSKRVHSARINLTFRRIHLDYQGKGTQ